MNMRRVKNIIQNILALSIIVVFANYLWDNRIDFFALLNVSWFYFAILGFGVLFTWVLNSLQVYYLLHVVGINIGFGENFLLFIATAMGNHVPMRLGTMLRLHYLKTVYNLQYAKAGSVIGVRMIILLFVSGILGVIGIFGHWYENGIIISYQLLMIYMGMIFLSIIVYLKPPKKYNKRDNLIFRIWNDFTEGFEVLHGKPKILLYVMVLTILQLLTMSARLYLSFVTIGFYPSLFILFLLAPVGVIMVFIAITPGGIGLREGLIGIISRSAGYDFKQGVFAGSIDRAFMLLLIFSIGTYAFIYIWFKIKRAENKIQEHIK